MSGKYRTAETPKKVVRTELLQGSKHDATG
jgi:hypothetical protein